VAFRHENKILGEIRITEEYFDTFNYITIIYIKCLVGNDDLFTFEFGAAWKFVVDDLVQLP
jgi:hypothetical protein